MCVCVRARARACVRVCVRVYNDDSDYLFVVVDVVIEVFSTV